MLFIVSGKDHPNGLAKRLEFRPGHRAHYEALGDRLILSGPYLDAQGAGQEQGSSDDEQHSTMQHSHLLQHGQWKRIQTQFPRRDLPRRFCSAAAISRASVHSVSRWGWPGGHSGRPSSREITA